MPPKTAASVVRNGTARPHPKGSDRHAAKEEPAAPVHTGPQVKSQIVNAAPAPAGKSFLDALRSGKKPAAPATKVVAPAAAAAAATPAAEERAAAPAAATPVPEAKKASPVPEPAKEEPVVAAPAEEPVAAAAAPAPAPVEAVPEPVVEASPKPAAEPEVVAAPEPVAPAAATVVQVTDTNFSWADEDIQFQIRQPQYSAEYPTSVLENLARNVAFKAPEEQSTMASAIENLNRERVAFEQAKRASEDALKNREMELNSMEASLQARERQLHASMEALRVDRAQLQTQQAQLQTQQQQFQAQQAAAAQAAQAAQQRTSQTQSPAAQVSPSPAQSSQSPQQQQPSPHAPQPPQSRSNMYMGGGNYGVSEWVPDQRGWANEGAMGGAPNFDMYPNSYQGNYVPRNYHMQGVHRGGMRGVPQPQQQFGSRAPPMMAPPQQYSRAMPQVGNPRPQQQQPGMDFAFRPQQQQQYNPVPNSGYPQQRAAHW
jgi:hypothetical protein